MYIVNIIVAVASICALLLAYKANKKANKALMSTEDNDCILRSHQGHIHRLCDELDSLAGEVSHLECLINECHIDLRRRQRAHKQRIEKAKSTKQQEQ